MARAVAAALLVVGQVAAVDLASVTYDDFLRTHAEARDNDAVGYDHRAQLFSDRLRAIQLHNSNPKRTWSMALNKFADYTPEEFQRLLGYRSQLRGRAQQGAQPYANASRASSSFLQVRSWQGLADRLDWGEQAKNLAIKDQGQCGSCWAVAAATALEMTAEIQSKAAVPPTSFEQLVDCVPNKNECGGAGGCSGATSELAFEYVFRHGLLAEDTYKSQGYRARGGGAAPKCTGLPGGLPAGAKPVLQTGGFVRLPENRLQPVLEMLSKGPLVVSVDASSWGSYGGGVFKDCKPDAVVNHAVVMQGYGRQPASEHVPDMDYWLIRNSWGTTWGEGGTIRLQRHAADVQTNEQEAYCGMDASPKEGVGCAKGPAAADKPIKVCGMCGVLSDTSYPTDVRLAK